MFSFGQVVAFFALAEVQRFFCSYFAERALDSVIGGIASGLKKRLAKDSIEYQLLESLENALCETCKHFEWEYDFDAITDTFLFSFEQMDGIHSEDSLKKILETSVGIAVDDAVMEYWLYCFHVEVTKPAHSWLFNLMVINDILKHSQKIETLESNLRSGNKFSQKIDSIRDKEKNHQNPFHYLSGNIGFYGREAELKDFTTFLYDEKQVLSIAVTGFGGSGKSKFVFEAITTMKKEERDQWKFVYLDSGVICDFATNTYENYYYQKKLCLVVDYAGRSSDNIGAFMCRVGNMVKHLLPSILRIVLIERQGITKHEGEANNATIIPDWYYRISKKAGDSVPLFGFLELSELAKDDLMSMAFDYRNKDGIGLVDKLGKELAKQEWESIYEISSRRGPFSAKLKTIRPLIILFMIDASISNLNDYRKWSIEDILQSIIYRYKKHWLENLCENNEEFYKALETLLMYSTACKPWHVGDHIVGLETETIVLNEQGKKKLSQILPYLNEFNVYEEQILAFEPDLMGEFFVLDILNDIASPEKRKKLVQLFWRNNPDYFSFFLQMCIDDYSYSKVFASLFDEFTDLFLAEADIDQVYEGDKLRAGVLYEITYIGISKRTKEAIQLLRESLEKGKKDSYLTLRYVMAMSNRITDAMQDVRDVSEARELLLEIQRVSSLHINDGEIIASYCEATKNLIVAIGESIADGDSKRQVNIKCNMIEELLDDFEAFITEHSCFTKDIRVTVYFSYINCLVNPMTFLDRTRCIRYLNVAKSYVDTDYSIAEFAAVLENFSSRDDVRTEDILPFYQQLCEWAILHREMLGSKFHKHIGVMVNLSALDENVERWIRKIKHAYEENPSTQTALYYSLALLNLVNKKFEDPRADEILFVRVVKTVKDMLDTYNDTAILRNLCYIMLKHFEFIVETRTEKAVSIARELLTILESCENSVATHECSEIAFHLAIELIKFVILNDEEDVMKLTASSIIFKLNEIFIDYPEMLECNAVALEYYIDYYSNVNETKSLTKYSELKTLYMTNRENSIVVECFADAIASISCFVDESALIDDVKLLKGICLGLSDSEKCAFSYVLAIRNYSSDAAANNIEEHIDSVLLITEKHSRCEEIITECLVILYNYLIASEQIARVKELFDRLKKACLMDEFHTEDFCSAYSALLEGLNNFDTQEVN